MINNAPHVSRAKREAVERAVRTRLRPRPTARHWPPADAERLASRSREMIRRLFADPFFAQVIVGASAALEETELQLMLCWPHRTGVGEVERTASSRGADGVMLMALRGDDPLVDAWAENGLPVVFGGPRSPGTHRGTWTPITGAALASPLNTSSARGAGGPSDHRTDPMPRSDARQQG